MDITIISSVYNEKGNLIPLVEAVVDEMENYPHVSDWEYILVDDASMDGSWQIMQKLADRFPQYVRLFQHPNRRGQKGCFMTGFANARGKWSILMDADLQVLPSELPLLLDKVVKEEYEMVCTYNDSKRRGKRRSLVSRIGNICMKVFFRSPVRDAGGNFMVLQTRYIRGVNLVANDQRYLLPICMGRGVKKVGEVGCVFGERGYGTSKYSKWKKMLQGVPEMWALKRRLNADFYALPPVESGEIARDLPIERTDNTWLITHDDELQAYASWKPLPWDSDVLGFSCGSIDGLWASGSYIEQSNRLCAVLSPCVTYAEQQGVRFLSLRLSENELAALHVAEAVGFRVIESYLTFRREGHTEIPAQNLRVRPARPDDVETVADLAGRSLHSYRFFVDPLIPQARARHSRREWVRNAFAGRAEAIYVAERSGSIAGFVLLKSKSGLKDLQHEENPNKIGVIDLIVVDSKYEGLGLGKGLVTQAIRHYHGTASAVEVRTQGKNIRAIGLYTRMGFFLVGSEFSLHKHAELA